MEGPHLQTLGDLQVGKQDESFLECGQDQQVGATGRGVLLHLSRHLLRGSAVDRHLGSREVNTTHWRCAKVICKQDEEFK